MVIERLDGRHLTIVDPRLTSAASVADDFPYGNAETLTNVRAGDTISFFLSGNLSRLGSARVRRALRATWVDGTADVEQAQRVLDQLYHRTCGLDAGVHCRPFGCAPRVWHVSFDTDLPTWGAAESARGVVATLDRWDASDAVVKDSHLHHGRFGIRWKSSDGVISGNRISARYLELSPVEFYMEGPFRLANVSVTENVFSACAAPVAAFGTTQCTHDTHIPLGHWCQWAAYGGGCGGVCKSASVGASQLDADTCTRIDIERNEPRAEH